jgi:glutamine amidotransferase
MSLAIVDYGSGNLRSAAKAFERAAREAGLSSPILVTSDPETIAAADRLVLPGVGAFKDCRDGLDAAGVAEALTHAVRVRGAPFLGICVGMQLLASRGLEHETTEGLGWIAGDVVRFDIDPALRIPHMGWNTLEPARRHPLLDGIETGPAGLHAYFVHSYVIRPADPADVIATSDYGGPFPAIVGRGNIAGTQFHPEKSQALGLALIGNFLAWSP